MVTADELSTMLAQLVNGVPKDKCTVPMDDEHSAAWDRLVTEVAEIKAAGHGVDVPGEWPELVGPPPVVDVPLPPADNTTPAAAPPAAAGPAAVPGDAANG